MLALLPQCIATAMAASIHSSHRVCAVDGDTGPKLCRLDGQMMQAFMLSLPCYCWIERGLSADFKDIYSGFILDTCLCPAHANTGKLCWILTHGLLCLQDGNAYLFVVSASDKQWSKSQSKLRKLQESFRA